MQRIELGSQCSRPEAVLVVWLWTSLRKLRSVHRWSPAFPTMLIYKTACLYTGLGCGIRAGDIVVGLTQQSPVVTYSFVLLRVLPVREAPVKDTPCSNGILPDSVSTPPPSSKRTLCGRYFSPKISKFFKTAILTLGMDILTITMVKHDS